MAAKILKYLHFGATSCGELETFMSSVLSKETCMRWFVTLNVIFMVLYIQVCTKIGTFVLGHFPQSDVHRIDCELDLLNIADLLCDAPVNIRTKTYPKNSNLILFWFLHHL